MNNPEDNMSQDPSTEGTSIATPNHRRSGRIAYDERGNSFWEWELETGVYGRNIDTQRLQRLDLSDLSLVDTAAHPIPAGLDAASAAAQVANSQAVPGAGSNPYDNTSTAGGNVGSNPYNSAGPATLKPELKAAAPRKPMDLQQQQEWLEIRKRAQQKERDDNGA